MMCRVHQILVKTAANVKNQSTRSCACAMPELSVNDAIVKVRPFFIVVGVCVDGWVQTHVYILHN